MSSDKLYQRTHEFTPYTTADGKAVQAEFDAIESALDHFPKMCDDGTGFAVSPVIPEPTEDDHPVNYGMYLTGVNNVKANRDEVERLTIEVRQHTQEVAANTQAVHNNTQTVLTVEQNVINKEIAAEESENMARKWASNPEDVLVKDNKYSAYHYALKAKNSAAAASQSEINAARSESASNTSANFAEQKANEANTYAEQARQAAFRENRWGDIVDSPSFNSTVTSTSTNTFATPKAVKMAYDKAVDAYTRAETAESNAKSASLPITGGTLSGDLTVPNITIDNGYVNVNPKGDAGGIHINRKGASAARFELWNDDTWKLWIDGKYDIFFPKKGGIVALDHEVVHRTGDTTTWLGITNTDAWLTLKSTNHFACGVDFINWNGQHPQASVHAQDVGGFSNDMRFYLTPPGNDYNSDRRQHVMTVGWDGNIWSKMYGWLGDRFMDKTRCYDNWYPNHYRGAQVFKIPTRGDGGLKVTVMQADINGDTELWLPENYDGFYIPTATDIGAGRKSLGVVGLGGNKIKVFVWSNATVQIHCIGWSN